MKHRSMKGKNEEIVDEKNWKPLSRFGRSMDTNVDPSERSIDPYMTARSGQKSGLETVPVGLNIDGRRTRTVARKRGCLGS